VSSLTLSATHDTDSVLLSTLCVVLAWLQVGYFPKAYVTAEDHLWMNSFSVFLCTSVISKWTVVSAIGCLLLIFVPSLRRFHCQIFPFVHCSGTVSGRFRRCSGTQSEVSVNFLYNIVIEKVGHSLFWKIRNFRTIFQISCLLFTWNKWLHLLKFWQIY